MTKKYDSYRPSPPPSYNSHGYDSYSRDRDPSYRGGSGDRDRGLGGMSSGRGYYNRPSPPEPSRVSADTISYPPLNSGVGGFSRSTATVGYGSAGAGKSSVVPPGWPSGGSDKSNANRPPFATSGPWS